VELNVSASHGLRVYAQNHEIPRVYGGVGVAILSTPKVVITGKKLAKKALAGRSFATYGK
jgi:small subunit ribosomal protein S8